MLKLVELTQGTSIPFKCIDDTPGGTNLGRCEWAVQVVFKRKKIDGFFLYLFQHRNINHYWHWVGGDIDFTITSYEKLEFPNVWKVHYSEETKQQCIDLYPPNYANYCYVDNHGISFTRTPMTGLVFQHNQ